MLAPLDAVNMVYYVTYRAFKILKNRSSITRRLHALGCEHIHRAFWKVDEDKIHIVNKMLQNNHPTIMKRSRELQKPITNNEAMISLGSLIIIAYKVTSERNKVKIDTLLKKAPCIRLCRGVYTFCQLHKRFDKDQELVASGKFWRFILEIDQNATSICRFDRFA